MMRLAAQAYRPSSAINAYGIGRWTTVRRPSEIVTHARQPESLRDRGQDGCEHARFIREEERRGGVWILVWGFPQGVECD